MKTILIADDNEELLNILKAVSLKEGYKVVLARDGKEALHYFKEVNPDIILLDIMMPKIDGFDVCTKIRETSNVPVIMVTAKGEDYDKIMGLEIGADDYIVKPFSPAEVMARVKAVLRRVSDDENINDKIIKLDNLTINIADYSVMIDDVLISLTKKEIDLLWTLVKGRKRAYSRELILDLLWGHDYYGDPRTVDSHIKRLRAKLNKVNHPNWEIKTIRNVGYKFEIHNE